MCPVKSLHNSSSRRRQPPPPLMVREALSSSLYYHHHHQWERLLDRVTSLYMYLQYGDQRCHTYMYMYMYIYNIVITKVSYLHACVCTEDAVNLNEVFSSDVIRPLSSDHEVVSEVTTPWKQRVVLHICPSVSNRSALSPNLFTSLAKHVTFVGETT